MQPTPLEVMIALLPLTVLVGLLVLAALWLSRVSRLRELREKQVLAMIERGVPLPPDVAAATFAGANAGGRRRRSHTEERFKSGGIMLIGLGVALALVIGVAGGQTRVGLGVGAAVAAIGAAMLASALLSPAPDADDADEDDGRSRPPSLPSGPGDGASA